MRIIYLFILLLTVSSPKNLKEIRIRGVPQKSQESNWDCGPTSIAMIAEFFTKEKVTVKEVSKLCKDKQLKFKGLGTHPTTMKSVLNKLVKGKAIVEDEVTLERIKELIQKGYPIIMLYRTSLGNFKVNGHYVVLTGYDEKKKLFYFNDPGEKKPDLEWNIDEFWKRFNWPKKEIASKLYRAVGIKPATIIWSTGPKKSKKTP